MKKYDLDASKAKDMCVKKDKQRQSYYNYYSSKNGDALTAMTYVLTAAFLA